MDICFIRICLKYSLNTSPRSQIMVECYSMTLLNVEKITVDRRDKEIKIIMMGKHPLGSLFLKVTAEWKVLPHKRIRRKWGWADAVYLAQSVLDLNIEIGEIKEWISSEHLARKCLLRFARVQGAKGNNSHPTRHYKHFKILSRLESCYIELGVSADTCVWT